MKEIERENEQAVIRTEFFSLRKTVQSLPKHAA